VIFGLDSSTEDFKERRADREPSFQTPDAARRFQQAPGGTATVVLGGDGPEVPPLPSPGRSPPGGTSTLVLGGDYPHEILERAAVSSNKFASGASQNSGNTITDRPTTKIHYAPGGASSICLGEAQPLAGFLQVSSNAFANGSNQNAGNSITDRPTTRVHQAPGGDSSIVLGGGYPVDLLEAAGVEPAERPGERTVGRARRLQQSPGGNSSICLGSPEREEPPQVAKENVDTTNIVVNAVEPGKAEEAARLIPSSLPLGGC